MTHAARIAQAYEAQERAAELSVEQIDADFRRVAEHLSWTRLALVPPHLHAACRRMSLLGLIEMRDQGGEWFFRLPPRTNQ